MPERPSNDEATRLERNIVWGVQQSFEPRELLAMAEKLARIAERGSGSWVFANRKLAELLLEDEPWRAAAAARAAARCAPQDDACHALLGLALTLLGHHRCAARAYRDALAICPDNPWYAHNLGHLLDVALDRPQAAIPLLKQAFRSEPHLEIAASLAHALGRTGQANDGLLVLKKALLRHAPTPDHEALLAWLAEGAPRRDKGPGKRQRPGYKGGHRTLGPHPFLEPRLSMLIRARALWPLLALVVAGPLSRSALAQKPPTPVGSAPIPSGSFSSTWASVPTPSVTDPMLDRPPAASKIVPGWRDALALVKSRSVDLQVAVADVVRAEAQSRQTLAALFPSLTGSANATQQLIRASVNPINGEATTQLFPPRATTYGAGLSLSIPLINLRNWYALDTADLSVKIAQMTIAEQRRILAAGVANAIVNVVTTERVADLNRLGLRNALERLVLTKRRADLGVANALDVLRLQQDVESARSSIVSGDENLRQAREALGLALGVAEPYGVPAEMNLETFAHDSEQVCRKLNSIEERTDIAVATERINLARRGVEDVRRQYYPTVDLRSNYSLTLQPFYTVFKGSTTGGVVVPDTVIDRTNTIQAWSVAAVLSWNIYDGGARAASKVDAEAQVTQAELRTEQTRRQATIEVGRAGRAIQVADDSRKVAVSARDLAREAERLTRVSFDLGKGTSLELVDAGRQLRQAEIQLVLQEFNLLQARITSLLAYSACDY